MKRTQITMLVVGVALAISVIQLTRNRYRDPQATATPQEVASEQANAETTSTQTRALGGTSQSGATAGGIAVYDKVEQAPAWAVPFGKEFWRRSPSPATANEGQESAPPNLNLGDVIARVSHAIADSSPEGLPQVRAKTFTATFDGEGFKLSPHRPAGQKVVASTGGATEEGDEFSEPTQLKTTTIHAADPATEVQFKTVAVSTGAGELYSHGSKSVEWSVLGNTAQALLNESHQLVEHYEARGEGVEVTWVIGKKSSGPLQVEAQVSGLTYLGQNETGHHYGDRDGVARVRVGKAELVDSIGTKIEVPVIASADRISMTIDENTLTGLTYPIALDPVVAPEFGMGVAMADNQQIRPAIGGNTNGYLVAWCDGRFNTGSFATYCARVSSSGKVIDPTGILITTNGNVQQVAVAAKGTNYIVVWDVGEIRASRVTSSGIVVDSGGFLVTSNGFWPAVAASSGSNYLVTFTRDTAGTNGYDIYGARITDGGSVQDSGGFQIGSSTDTEYRASVASNGDGFLVAWDRVNSSWDNWDVRAARVTTGGTVLDSSSIAVSVSGTYNEYVPSVASIGTNYFVGWGDERNNATTGADVYGARITGAGVVQDASGIAICAVTNSQSNPLLAANGTNYLAVWVDLRDEISGYAPVKVFGARISSSGTILDTNGFQVVGQSVLDSGPAVASNGTDFLAVWSDEQNGSSTTPSVWRDIYGSRITGDGKVPDLIAISTAAAEAETQTYPAVAYSPYEDQSSDIYKGFLVVWEDNRNTSTNGLDIYATRVMYSLTEPSIRDLKGLAICTLTNSQERPSVACNGTNFLVTWMDKRFGTNYDVYAARVNNNGTVVDTNGFLVSNAAYDQQYPDPFSLNGDYFIAWQDQRASNYDVYGARVTSGGTVVDTTGIAITTATGSQRIPKVAGIGTNYFVVWFDQNFGGASSYDIRGARVNTSGTLIDTTPITVCNATNLQYYCDVATDGLNYLVVWQDSRVSQWDVYGARVSSAGTVLDSSGIAISTATNKQEFPAVSSTGTDYLVAWTDGRTSSTNPDVYGARVTSSGTVTDSTGFTISATASTQTFPALAANSSQYLAVYQSNASGTNRIRANLITP